MNLYRPGRDTPDWITVDDPVMGGISRSRTELSTDADGLPVLRFSGNVSLENNGGFCSTRTDDHHWHIPDVKSFTLDLRGDGKRYKFTVRTDDHDQGSYRVDFETRDGERTSLTFGLNDFEMYHRGRHLPDAPMLDTSEIRSLGFLISDGQAGSFQLDLYGIASRE